VPPWVAFTRHETTLKGLHKGPRRAIEFQSHRFIATGLFRFDRIEILIPNIPRRPADCFLPAITQGDAHPALRGSLALGFGVQPLWGCFSANALWQDLAIAWQTLATLRQNHATLWQMFAINQNDNFTAGKGPVHS